MKEEKVVSHLRVGLEELAKAVDLHERVLVNAWRQVQTSVPRDGTRDSVGCAMSG